MKPTTARLCIVLTAALALRFGPAGASLVALAVATALPRTADAQDAEAIAKVKDLNKKAVDAYENLELEEARKHLMQALEICAAEGLNRHAIKATTHLNLGVVLVGGLKQREAGTKQFRRAIEIDANVKVPKRLSNPEIQSAFEAATKGEGAEGDVAKPAPPVSAAPAPVTPPAAAAASTLTLVHEPVAEAPAGATLTLRAKVQGNGRFDKVVLAYRPEAGSDFYAREMDLEGDSEYVARIPDVALRGGTLAYYVEIRGRGGQALARNGSPDAPHVVALGGAGGSDGPGVASEEAATSLRAARTPTSGGDVWLSLGVGMGGGWTKGTPEVNPNYWDTNLNEKRPIQYSNVAVANLVHFNPEIGYFYSPRVLLSLQGRIQLTTGASEVRYPTCKPNGVCQPASGAVAVVGKATYLLEPKGKFQPYVSLSAGGGYIRYLVDIGKFNLEGCGSTDGANCRDTVAGGGALFGPSIGGWFQLGGPVFITGALSTLVGVPNLAANADLNLGLGYRM